MEEKEKNEFSWTGLFLVTGVCFIFFNGLLKLLDGSNMPVFKLRGGKRRRLRLGQGGR